MAPDTLTAGIGVPLAVFATIWLFLNDSNVPPELDTPVALWVIVLPPSRRAAPEPAKAMPKLLALIKVPLTIPLKELPLLTTTTPTLELLLMRPLFTLKLEMPPPPEASAKTPFALFWIWTSLMLTLALAPPVGLIRIPAKLMFPPLLSVITVSSDTWSCAVPAPFGAKLMPFWEKSWITTSCTFKTPGKPT